MQVKTLYTLKIQPDILTIYKDGKIAASLPIYNTSTNTTNE